MADTSKAYGYIQMEIERLKYEEIKANREANEKTLRAEIYMLCRLELESALDLQKKSDRDAKRIDFETPQ